MDGASVCLVRTNAAAVACKAFEIADVFIDRLTAECPDLGRKFRGDRARRRRALVQTFAWVAKNLGCLHSISGDLEATGKRLALSGFGRPHADAARRAILVALQEYSGTAWKPELAAAWGKALDEVFGAMTIAEARLARAA